MKRTLLILAALACACNKSFTPASYVQGLRVLAVKADLPEVAPGATTTFTVLAVDTSGAPIQVSWWACTEPELVGTGPINPACFNTTPEPFLLGLGNGLSLSAIVPLVTPSDFGPPDASGGLYLPVILHASSASGRVDAAYGLRLAQGEAPNQNPKLTGVYLVPSTGAPTPIDGETPFPVHAGDALTLQAQFTGDSAETYAGGPGQPATLTEILSASWFATAGSFSEDVTGFPKPNTVWTADEGLPPVGGTIDLWVVGRDNRGGTDWLHLGLVLQ